MGHVYKRRNKWYIDYYDLDGKRIRRVAGRVKSEALRILHEKEREKYYLREGIPVEKNMPTEEFFENFRSMRTKRVTKSTIDSSQAIINFWENLHLKK